MRGYQFFACECGWSAPELLERIDVSKESEQTSPMDSTRERVTMTGVLRGKGEIAKCRVSALRVTLSGTKLHIDCQHVIEWVSQSLPDGNYELSIEGKVIEMRLSNYRWQVVHEP